MKIGEVSSKKQMATGFRKYCTKVAYFLAIILFFIFNVYYLQPFLKIFQQLGRFHLVQYISTHYVRVIRNVPPLAASPTYAGTRVEYNHPVTRTSFVTLGGISTRLGRIRSALT